MTQKILDGEFVWHNGIKLPMNVIPSLWNRAMDDIAENNTWCPDITRIIYNDGKRVTKWHLDEKGKKVVDKTEPLLATIVEFNDGTKVAVTNSQNDPITLMTDKETGVETASERDKEIGLVYAIVKKLIGIPDAKGTIDGNGFGRILRDLVEKRSFVQKIEEKRAEMAKAKSKAEHIRLQKEAKPKVKRMSLAQAMDKLGEAMLEIEKLKAQANCPKQYARVPSAKKHTNKRAKRDAYGRFVKA